MTEVHLPHDWAPRPHQLALWDYILSGGKRASVWWHRRGGKDDVALNLIAIKSMQRVGTYWHMCPEKEQVRKAVWESINHRGVRRIDQAFPDTIRRRTLENSMTIELINGSMVHFLGSDRYDSNVGTNPIGIVFSEWALCDPRAWSYLSPILAARENSGWAAFITTPRGINHAYDMHMMASDDPRWFCETLTVEDTTDEHGQPLITQEMIDQERREGKPEHEIRQEYYCEALSDTEYQICAMADIIAAAKRPAPPDDTGAPTIIGYDVGLSGDPSVRVVRTGYDADTVPPRYCRDADFDAQADLLCEDIDRYKPDAVLIDETGVGYGLVPLMRARGYQVHGVNFGAADPDKVRYENLRAGMYHRLSQWLASPHASIHDSQAIRRQLAAIRYDPSRSRIKVLSKDKIKNDLGTSTDESDALALTFARPVSRRDARSRYRRQSRAIIDGPYPLA